MIFLDVTIEFVVRMKHEFRSSSGVEMEKRAS
jgi:hypothetical protein